MVQRSVRRPQVWRDHPETRPSPAATEEEKDVEEKMDEDTQKEGGDEEED